MSYRSDVFEVLSDAGDQEDNGLRYLNHFQNPNAPFYAAGLKAGWMAGMAASEWAHYTTSPQLNWVNEWSWTRAKEYWHIALTGGDFAGAEVAPTAPERQEYLRRTFRALGQVMHLVADMSSPPHTRDDVHAFRAGYEKWVEENVEIPAGATTSPIRTIVDAALTAPRGRLETVDPAIFEQGDLGLYNLFDTTPNAVGFNPRIDPGPNQNPLLGLAEYTNANFLSEDTTYRGFDRPALPVTPDYTWEPLANGRWRAYHAYDTTDGIRVAHHVREGLFTAPLAGTPLEPLTYVLDDLCHEDYAEVLVPRAISYAAGVLDRFFQHELTVTTPDGIDNGISYRIIRRGTRGEDGGAGEVTTERVTGSLSAYGIDATGDLALIRTWYVGAAEGRIPAGAGTGHWPALTDCYQAFLFVFRGCFPRNNLCRDPDMVIPYLLEHELTVDVPGASILDRFTANVVGVRNAACGVVPPPTAPAQNTIRLFGVDATGSEHLVAEAPDLDVTPPAGTPASRSYRISYEGTAAGRRIFLERDHDEFVERFLPVASTPAPCGNRVTTVDGNQWFAFHADTHEDVLGMGIGHGFLHVIVDGGVTFDGEVYSGWDCEYGPVYPCANSALEGAIGEEVQVTVGADSVCRWSPAAYSTWTPVDGIYPWDFAVTLRLLRESTGARTTLPVPNGVPLGDHAPWLFTTGQTYLVEGIDVEFWTPSSTPQCADCQGTAGGRLDWIRIGP